MGEAEGAAGEAASLLNSPFPKERGGVGTEEMDSADLRSTCETAPLILELLLTPPPKSLSLWAMMPGMAMSSSGERISEEEEDPPSTAPGLPAFPPAFDRGFINFVKDRRFPAPSPLPPAPADMEEASEISLMGDSLSPLTEVAEMGVDGDAMEAVLEEEAAGMELRLLSSTDGVF